MQHEVAAEEREDLATDERKQLSISGERTRR